MFLSSFSVMPVSVLLLLLCCFPSAAGESRAVRSDDPNSLEVLVQQQSQLIVQLQAQLTSVQSEVTSLKSKLALQNTKVVFRAHLSANQKNSQHEQTIVYDVVEENAGNGYDHVTGLFTARVAGLYDFNVKLAHVPPGHIQAGIMVNGHWSAETDVSGDTPDRSSVTVPFLLAKGDRVWVVTQPASVTLDSGYRTTFYGHLVQPDLD